MQMKIKLTFIEELLGTKAADPAVFTRFIASKHPDGTPQKDELDRADIREEAGSTLFHREHGAPGIYDYQVKGFFKDAMAALNRFDKEARNNLEKLAAFKSKIDGAIFVSPRFIPILLPPGAATGTCERPLRADTAQGPRVSVVRSETVPAGSALIVEIQVFAKELQPYLELMLNYGKLRGLGQWRNSGKGRFTWENLP